MGLLEVRQLTKRFGGLTAVGDVSFTVAPGETVGMIGPNGAGKTTVFALVSGFHEATRGEVRFKGARLNGLRPDEICHRGLVRTFQIVQPFPLLTVLENVMVGACLRESGPAAAGRRAAEVLETVGMAAKRDMMARNLTLADLKRLEIARALATGPDLVLLDETMAGLTPVEVEEMIGLVRRLRGQGITFMLIEHVMQAIMSLSDRIIVLHHGEKIAEGAPRQVADDPRVIEAYLGRAAA